MAVRRKRIVIDIDNFKKTPQYAQILERIKADPVKAFKELTILSETENPLSTARGGLGLLNDLKKQIPITQEQVDTEFQPAELPEPIKLALDKDPATVYQKIYNLYNYEPKVNKVQARAILSGAKKYLHEKNLNPDDYLTKSPFWKGLEAVANFISVPTNALAKVFAKNPDKVKIWGGNGWEETLRQYGMRPDIQSLVEKRQKGIPLVGEDKKKLEDFDTKYAILGFIGNVVGDPIILTGIAGKALTGISKGAGALGKVGKVLTTISSPIRSYKQAKRAVKFVATEFDDVLKNTLTTAKRMLGDNHALVGEIDDVLRKVKVDPGDIKMVDKVSSALNALGRTKESQQFLKAGKAMSSALTKAETTTGSKVFQTAQKVDKKLSSMVKNFQEKSGIRKLFISDLPEKAKGVYDKARRMALGAKKDVAQSQVAIAKAMKPLRKALEADEGIKAYMKATNSDIDSVISQMIERPKEWEKVIKDKPVFNKIRETMDDFILTEAKFVGDKIKPLATKDIQKQWAKIANEYSALAKTNPFNPDLAGMKNDLKKLLNHPQTQGVKILDESVINDLTDNIAYLTHSMTDDAKKIYLKMDGKTRGSFSNAFKSYITNKSKLQRNFKGTIKEINESISSGEFSQMIRDMYPDDQNMLKLANDFSQFKNVKFFDTDVGKLIGIRGTRMAKTIEQSIFYDGIKEFGSATKTGNMVKPLIGGKPIAGLSDLYFEPDVAKAIEKMWGYTKDERAMKVLLNTLEDFSNFWKAMTLSTHIATPMRNMLGNIFNGLLVVDKPAYLLQSVKDVFAKMMGKNYNVVTDTGKVLDLDTVWRAARERGIEATTFRDIDIGRGIREPAETAVAKVGEKIGDVANAGVEWLKNAPIAKINDVIEGNSKMALFLTKVREGASFDDAAKDVYKALFDYSELTSFERDIKKVIPFFSWARKNLPLQIGNLMSEPSRFLIKGVYAMRQNRPSDEVQDLRQGSEYLQSKMSVPIFKDDKGQQHFLMLEGLVPLFDSGRILRAFAGDNRLQAVVDDLMADVSPLIKTPVEILANRNFAFKTELRKSPYDVSQFLGFYMSPELKAILDDWRLLATANKGIPNPMTIGVDPKNTTRMVIGYLLGNTIPFDPYYAKIISGRDAVKNIQNELTGYRGFLNKMGAVMSSGKKPTKYDADVVFGRAKNILLMLEKAYVSGKITGKERGNYTKQLISNFIPLR